MCVCVCVCLRGVDVMQVPKERDIYLTEPGQPIGGIYILTS